MPTIMMAARCPRCGGVYVCDYDDRYVRICIGCLRNGYLIHTRLIPKGFIDPEAVATTVEQYLTWDEYCDRLKSEQGTEATGNVPAAEE